MASNINYTSIDETFPIAGKDNDSQGFRDNFSIIKNNFEAAKGEVEDLQLNTARVDDSNDFNGNNLTNFNMVKFTEELYDGGVISSTTGVDWTNGPYQIFTVNANLQLTVFNLPQAGKVGKLKIHLLSDGTARQITIAVDGSTAIKKSSRVPATITVASNSNPVILELWTFSAGSTVFLDYLGIFS